MPHPFLAGLLLILVLLAGCGQRTDSEVEKRLNMPVVPEGFDPKAVEKLRCPVNGSKLHFATKREIEKINAAIGSFKVRKFSDGEPYTEMVEAMLLRADGKIGYRVEKNEAFLKTDDALILDENFK